MLTFDGSGIEGPIISHNLNPSSTGEVRLAKDDQINFRNEADSGDIVGLSRNSGDVVVVGGALGMSSSAISSTGNISTTTSFIGPTIIAPGGQDLVVEGGATADVHVEGGAGIADGGNVTITGGLGGLIGNNDGGNVAITGGAGHGSGVNGTIDIGTSQTSAINLGVVSKVNTLPTTGNGIPCSVAEVSLIDQSAAITTTTLYSVIRDGQYRLNWSAKVLTAGTTSSTLGALTIVYTDVDAVAVTLTAGAVIAAGTVATTSTANTTGTVLHGISKMLNCKTGTDITYAFAYASNAAAEMKYNLHIILEAM